LNSRAKPRIRRTAKAAYLRKKMEPRMPSTKPRIPKDVTIPRTTKKLLTQSPSEVANIMGSTGRIHGERTEIIPPIKDRMNSIIN